MTSVRYLTGGWTRATGARRAIPVSQRQPLDRVARALALLVLFASGLVDLPRDIPVGPVTGQAILTIIYLVAAALMLPFLVSVPSKPTLRNTALMLFFCWAALSLAWTTAESNGIQNVLAIGTFISMLLLGEKVASQDPGFAFWLDRRLKWSVVSAVAIYAVSLAAFGLGSDNIVSARNFGLFALFGVAQQLGAWRYGSKVGLWIALAIAAMIAAS
jgi:hypothetical protein